jgi:hypothetical protein
MKLRRTPERVPGPAPELVLLDLGYSWDDILNLKEQGGIIA